MSDRHPSTQHLLDQLNSYQHLPESLGYVSAEIAATACSLTATLSDGPELSVGLRHLLDAKDALVRQRVADLKASGAPKLVNTPEREITAPPAVFRVHREVVDGETVRVLLEPIREDQTVELSDGDEFVTGTLAADPWPAP